MISKNHKTGKTMQESTENQSTEQEENTNRVDIEKIGSDIQIQASSKFPSPKILLVDLNTKVSEHLEKAGYNIFMGSFGKPYKVPAENGYLPIIWNGFLPKNYSEYRVVIIDLAMGNRIEQPLNTNVNTAFGVDTWWCKANSGKIDPRLGIMDFCSHEFELILNHGGVFIIFAEPTSQLELIEGHIENRGLLGNGLVDSRRLSVNNWSFLPVLYEHLITEFRVGEEVKIVKSNALLVKTLETHIKDISYTCTLNFAQFGNKNRNWNSYIQHDVSIWLPLLTNIYGQTVGGILPPAGNRRGWIFILPRFNNIASFLTKMLDTVLPELTPELFPHVEGAKWITRKEYELPNVLTLHDKIEQIRSNTQQQITNLEQQIEEERTKHNFLYEVLQGTDDKLVSAVKKTLEFLGFEKVIDSDAELEQSGTDERRREDLQIHDSSPIILVEVKGIKGLPTDEAALASGKYQAPRMKQLGRTDITSLSIINHQRYLPPFERENDKVFDDDILENAKYTDIALMTTWDLFRLARNVLKNEWKSEYVKPLFYRVGRVSYIPIHYQYLGKIELVYPKIQVIGVRLQEGELKTGDKIALEYGIEFEETDAKSLYVNNQKVDKASTGDGVGIQIDFPQNKPKEGLKVYRIITASS
jgi:hypothetical protein